MAAKTLLEVFSRYLPDGETRSLMEGTFLSGNMKVDRNLRMIEIHFTSDTLIPKVKLYKLENDICKSYALRSVRLFPIYPKNLFTETYFSDIMEEAYRTNIISKSFLQDYHAVFNGFHIDIEIMFDDGGVEFVEYNQTGRKIADIIYREFGIKYEIDFKKSNHYIPRVKENIAAELVLRNQMIEKREQENAERKEKEHDGTTV